MTPRGGAVASINQETPASRPESPGRYGLLLALLVGSYLLSSFVSARWVTALNVALYATAVVLALRSAEVPQLVSRLIFLVVIAGSAVVIGLAAGTTINVGVLNLWVALVLLAGVVVIVHRVLSFGTVTLSSIFGAVSAYLLLGLMFASVYAAIDHLGAGHFFANGQSANGKTLQYFSFTTLTTLGYGDFTAAGSGGRSVAMLEALGGQVFLATLVARLVSAYGGSSRRRPPPGK